MRVNYTRSSGLSDRKTNLMATNIDEIDIDELEEEFLSILPKDTRDDYLQLGSKVEQLQFIIDLIKTLYLPFFENDEEMEQLLDEIDILVDVNDPEFELTADIVEAFVQLATYVRQEDVHNRMENNLLIILTYALELIDE